ncbi:citrate transporter [Xylanimonas ulmi]|uniref:Citrate transporter n=1 Tax=Xylanimonas ulmi TaxID=228973 RepID=A0A4Q7M8Z3_9MICO|nr:citrate transporter [Xylanibacterium ulmi]RZS62649.1 hypothetical protein EV386_2993 [Xylanibacterium ulmi]
MVIAQGILLLATFAALIYYCFKGGNLLIGFLVTSVLWCVIAQVPVATVVTDVFQASVGGYGGTIAIIVFGAWFGKVIVDTGIAGSIIKKVVELAGDKALLTTILLVVVCTAIFTSAFGVGSVMAIGMIVLPIMFSMGVRKNVALAAFMFSVAGGMWLNIAYVSQFYVFFGENLYQRSEYIRFALVATAIHVMIAIAFVVFHHIRSKTRVRLAWAAPAPSAISDATRSAPVYSFVVPFVPIVMVAIFKWQPVPSFLVGILLGMLLTGNLKSYRRLVDVAQKTLHDGISECGLLIGMLYGIVIFQAAAAQAAPILQHLLGGLIPSNPLVLALAFGVLAPLALFRGPLMIFGSGAATVAILQATGNFENWTMFALFLVMPVAVVANTCPTQSWGMWGLSYSKVEPRTYLATGVLWSWALALILEPVAYAMIGRLS